jgi:DNA-binding MarR family transcriptional regulator
MTIDELIKQKSFESNNLKAYINLVYTYHYFNSLMTDMLKPYQILPQHYNVMKIIKGSYPRAVTPSQILDVMLDKKRDITRLVDKLEDLGYVERNVSDANKRNVHISITKLGLEITRKLEKKVAKDFKHYLTEDQSAKMSDLLDRMRCPPDHFD